MSVFYPDNAQRATRVQNLVNDIVDFQNLITTNADQMDTTMRNGLQALNLYISSAGASSYEDLVQQMSAQLTPDQLAAYNEMLTFNKQFGDATDEIMQLGGIIFLASAATKATFDLVAFGKTVGLMRVVRSYAAAFRILVTQGWAAGTAAFNDLSIAGDAFIEEFTESSKFADFLGVAAGAADVLMVLGVAASGLMLILQAIEGAEQKTKLIDAIHNTQVLRLSCDYIYKESVVITSMTQEIGDWATALQEHGASDPGVIETAQEIATNIATYQNEISLSTAETELEGTDANRNDYTADDLPTATVIAQATAVLPSNRPVANGTYYVVNAQTGSVLDQNEFGTANGTSINGFVLNGGTNQQWVLSATGGTVYSIQNVAAGTYISHVQTNPTTPFQTLQANTQVDNWQLNTGTINGAFFVETTMVAQDDPATGKYWDLEYGSSANGTPIILQTLNTPETTNQQWRFIPLANLPIIPGIYTIVNAQTGTLLDLQGGATASGTAIDGEVVNGGNNQQWTVSITGDGTYTFQNLAAGTYASNVQVSITTPYNTLQANTQPDSWQITAGTQAGAYYITTTTGDGNVLDLENASSANSTPVIINTMNNPQTLNQQWKFVASTVVQASVPAVNRTQ